MPVSTREMSTRLDVLERLHQTKANEICSTKGREDSFCRDLENKAKSWQIFYLRFNGGKLDEMINFTQSLFENLHQKKALSQFYLNKARRLFKQNRTYEFFHIPFSTTNYYDDIITVLEETKQDAALAFLEKGHGKWLELKNETRMFSSSDFYFLVEALAYKCNMSCFKQIFESPDGNAALHQTNERGYGLMHVAVGTGNIDAIKYLCKAGLDLNSKSLTGRTPLHRLGRYSNNVVEVTKILLENGADLYVKDSDNDTVAHTMFLEASPTVYLEWMEYMSQKQHGNLWFVKGFHGRTPIHTAVTNMEVSVDVLNLMSSELSFDFNIGDDDGSTVLMLAAVGGQDKAVLECIVQLGGDWEKKDAFGKTVLHYSVQGGNLEAVDFFLSLGADPNARDMYENIPLHYVDDAWLNHTEVTCTLLENDADILAKNMFGETVAHLFCRKTAKMEDYLDWKNFLNDVGYQQLFLEKNFKGELPL